MYKAFILSLLTISGALYSFDNETDPAKLYNELSNDSERTGLLSSFFNRAQEVASEGVHVLTGILNSGEVVPASKDVFMQAPAIAVEAVAHIPATELEVQDVVAPVEAVLENLDPLIETIKEAVELEQASQVLEVVSEVLETLEPVKVAEGIERVVETIIDDAPKAAEVLSNTAAQIKDASPADAKKIIKDVSKVVKDSASDMLEQAQKDNPVHHAVIRDFFSACWNSKPIDFAFKMFNPKAHMTAWTAMWKAGFKDALPTLWNEHKPVIAGTVVITTASAAALYYAYKKGMFEQAKKWIAKKQEQCQACFA